MKRAVAALAVLGIVSVTTAPSMAAATVYGSAKLTYTVNATAAISIAVNYDVNGNIQPAVAGVINPSSAGVCTAGVAEGAGSATLTFGGITPPSGAGYNGCYYKNAMSIGVQSNDALGVQVIEYVDTLQPGTQVCEFQLDAAPAAVKPTQSGAPALPAAYAASCPTVNGKVGVALAGLGAATVGTGTGGAGVPAGVTTNVTATPTATTYTAGGATLYNGLGVSGAAFKFIGQDIQMNVSGAAASGAATDIITVALIPN